MCVVDCSGLCRELAGLLVVEDDAAGLGIRVAYSLSWGRPVRELDPGRLVAEEEKLLAELRERYRVEELPRDPLVRTYRDFYWRIGIDPTKTRPSSEALVRRALRGKWPRINPVVDAGNIASARMMVPVGLYDAAKFKPPLRITLARGGEEFHPIGGKPEKLEQGTPILVDGDGRVMHVYPHRDSVETMVAQDTTCILIVAAGVPGVQREQLVETVKEVQRLVGLLGWSSCSRVEAKP
ncbi:B3/4 domain-containing protein [Hyperthermus butylicus]|uniref:Conserved archaeal protein n=1 Tax=Hyperthermus butylicus (strain DSM 5456 / JCM 9403 / PLM1-5) TaxID=415426 RepID=A2BMP0_HYPBU|nr:phenylalanine--tRNA ligase beta subunit-related protein [Hyperthermus butylicus]ABM81251.1 conserved archaeal protein [Hyperthermus butylicus DSM 5456]